MKTVTIEIENRWRANIRGPQSWELCRQAAGRRPVWSHAARAWVVSERSARDVVALAEHAGLNVVVSEPHVPTEAPIPEAEHELGGLW